MLTGRLELCEHARCQTGRAVKRQVDLFCLVMIAVAVISASVAVDAVGPGSDAGQLVSTKPEAEQPIPDRDMRDARGAPTSRHGSASAPASPLSGGGHTYGEHPTRPASNPAIRGKDAVRRQVAQYKIEMPARRLAAVVDRPASDVPCCPQINLAEPVAWQFSAIAADLEPTPLVVRHRKISRAPP